VGSAIAALSEIDLPSIFRGLVLKIGAAWLKNLGRGVALIQQCGGMLPYP
jgi:hypothetical protein